MIAKRCAEISEEEVYKLVRLRQSMDELQKRVCLELTSWCKVKKKPKLGKGTKNKKRKKKKKKPKASKEDP